MNQDAIFAALITVICILSVLLVAQLTEHDVIGDAVAFFNRDEVACACKCPTVYP